MNSSPTLSVDGRATIRQRPSILMLLSEVSSSGPTLELAIARLEQKRAAVAEWMARLGAQDVRFAEPRFPDQVEPKASDLPKAMRRRIQQQLGMGAEPSPEPGQIKSVVVCFSANWSIEGLASGEVMILVDRIQFEMSEAPAEKTESDEPHSEGWLNSIEEARVALRHLWEPTPEGSEPHFLFLSQVSEDQHEAALAEAFRDAKRRAQMIARAAGHELLAPISFHVTRTDSSAMEHVRQIQRQQSMPALSELPLDKSTLHQTSESPRAAEFTVSVHMTWSLKHPIGDTAVP